MKIAKHSMDGTARTAVLPYLNRMRIALCLPCLNEEKTLAQVIRDFRAEIPQLEIFVFDNGSTDRSAAIALDEGVHLIRVPIRGKGNVVRRMFDCVDADIMIMVDSDNTYDATGIWDLLAKVILEQVDMAVGSRVETSQKAYRKFHRFGNGLIIRLINLIFKSDLNDICSGYRVMSRYFYKNIPLLRNGFEVETELAVYSLINHFSIVEVPLPYRERPADSFSKLRTFSDGYKILLTIVWLMRDLRPLLFFSALSVATILLSIFGTSALSIPVYLQMLMAAASVGLFVTGVLLNSINVKFSESHSIQRRYGTKSFDTEAQNVASRQHRPTLASDTLMEELTQCPSPKKDNPLVV